MAQHGKRLRAVEKAVDRQRVYTLEEAVKVVTTHAGARFDETVELAVNLGVDPRHSEQQVRGRVSLPHGTGRSVRVAVFARGDRAQEASEAGADLVGDEDLMERIQGGEINFDRCIATPDMMVLVGRLGKILGPRGLMPNPKLGTVTLQVGEAVKAAKGGEVQFRTDKAGLIHGGVGKASFTTEFLVANVRAFVAALQSAKPQGTKGTYFKRVALSSTMGIGVRVDVASCLT